MTPFWQFGLLGIVIIAMVTDLQTRKIYNWLTFPAMLVGLVLNIALGGVSGLESSLIGLAAGSLLFVVGFLMGAMGAGDVKLMAAVGLWLGWPHTLAAVVYVTVAGALVAIVSATANGSLPKLLNNVKWFFLGLIIPGAKATVALGDSAAPPVPYGVSIAIGTALALLFPQMDGLLSLLHGG
ncbi:MAG TPA: A24 family peptidase [Oscillatoriaceae cyanobacterium]